MEEFKLGDCIFEQIKDFNHQRLTDEQKLLIDKLILNKELKECYKENGLCKECKQPKASCFWCQCKFQQNFKNWTSGNNEVDKFIQKTQLKAKERREFLEWIEYDKFENVEYLAKGGFGTIHKAIWKDGCIVEWDSENNEWKRKKDWMSHENFPVVLKCLHNSQDITSEFLKEIESHTMIISNFVTQCFGITKDPKSNNFMMVMEYAKEGSLRQYLNNIFNSIKWVDKLNILQKIAQGLNSIHKKGLIHHDFHCDPLKRPNAEELHKLLDNLYGYEFDKQIEEADKINEKLTSSSLPYNGITLSYTTNSQAVYISRLLDLNLPEPKNAINDNSFEKYSESIEAIDFTKLT
ncbi:uncharacterized protein OCT59_015676 [Rhizophagus irregularis]|nr:hypothetical protein OCT59_015676 [Rhizophagus irregularis]